MHIFGQREEMLKTLVLFLKNGKKVKNTEFLRGSREPPRRKYFSLGTSLCHIIVIKTQFWIRLGRNYFS